MSETPFDAHTLRNEPLDQSDAHHVDVQEAENAFHTLSRRLTRRHNHSTAGSTTPEKTSREYDPEKAAPSDEEPFDLREYLSSSNDANEKAGIKHKHVGVTWEDLQVEIAGSAFTKVCIFARMPLSGVSRIL